MSDSFLCFYMPNIFNLSSTDLFKHSFPLSHSSTVIVHDLFKHSFPLSHSSTVHCPAHAYFYVYHRLIWDSILALYHDRYYCFDLIASAFFWLGILNPVYLNPVVNQHFFLLHSVLYYLKDKTYVFIII